MTRPLALALFAFGLTTPSLALAAPEDGGSCAHRERGEGGRAHHGGRGFGRLVRELGELELTAEQRELAEALEDGHRPERSRQSREESASWQALEAARAGQPVDAAALRLELEQRTAARAAHAEEQLELALELYASLDEVQRAELGERLEAAAERRSRRGGHRDRGADPSSEG